MAANFNKQSTCALNYFPCKTDVTLPVLLRVVTTDKLQSFLVIQYISKCNKKKITPCTFMNDLFYFSYYHYSIFAIVFFNVIQL